MVFAMDGLQSKAAIEVGNGEWQNDGKGQRTHDEDYFHFQGRNTVAVCDMAVDSVLEYSNSSTFQIKAGTLCRYLSFAIGLGFMMS